MTALEIFPISYKVRGQKIVIVGGGVEALAKARLATKTCAEIIVISSHFSADFSGLKITLIRRAPDGADVQDAALIFVASSGVDADLAIGLARQNNIPLNVVDRPDLCDFYTPAIVERAPVSIAISTQGSAPVLARLVRARIEAVLEPNLGLLALVAGEMRQLVERILPGMAQRRRYFESFFEAQLARPGSPGKAASLGEVRDSALRLLGAARSAPRATPAVWLVGAGPGAVDLLTLRAQRLLQQADVIAYEGEIPRDLIQMGRRDAHLVALERSVSRAMTGQLRAVLGNLAKTHSKIVWLVRENPDGADFATDIARSLRKIGLGVEIVPGIAALPEPIGVEGSAARSIALPPVALMPAPAFPTQMEN